MAIALIWKSAKMIRALVRCQHTGAMLLCLKARGQQFLFSNAAQ